MKQSGSKTYAPQPGQVVVLSETDILVSAPWLNSGYMSNRCFGLRAGVPTLLPASILTPNTDGWRMHNAGAFSLIDGEGVQPEIVDAANSRERTEWTTGAPPPIALEQLVDHYQGAVIDRSLAQAVAMCVQEGIPEDVVLQELVRIYDNSFTSKPPTASSQPWLKQAELMRDANRARKAGLS